MRRQQKGTLKNGSGRRVKNRKQGIAIGLNEARKKGAKVPRRRPAACRQETLAWAIIIISSAPGRWNVVDAEI
jgi:Family of unknown function (DUF6496)